jgi:hypothetical protein
MYPGGPVTENERPLQLAFALAQLGSNKLDEIRAEARQQRLDFLTLACAKALNRPYESITGVERHKTKIVLFSYLYNIRDTPKLKPIA